MRSMSYSSIFRSHCLSRQRSSTSWRPRRGLALAEAAYYNFLVAAIATVPAVATGVLAWQFQLAGRKLEGVLLAHLTLAGVSSLMIWLVWWLHHRRRKTPDALPGYCLPIEWLAIAIVTLTGYLGGILSGVNRPG